VCTLLQASNRCTVNWSSDRSSYLHGARYCAWVVLAILHMCVHCYKASHRCTVNWSSDLSSYLYNPWGYIFCAWTVPVILYNLHNMCTLLHVCIHMCSTWYVHVHVNVQVWVCVCCLPSRHSGAVKAGVPAERERCDSLVSISSETPKSAIWIIWPEAPEYEVTEVAMG
jgi:hypothetical protein